jgi:hypothetical protein
MQNKKLRIRRLLREVCRGDGRKKYAQYIGSSAKGGNSVGLTKKDVVTHCWPSKAKSPSDRVTLDSHAASRHFSQWVCQTVSRLSCGEAVFARSETETKGQG